MVEPNPLDFSFVNLQTAVLCADCDLIAESRSGACPVCGGRGLLSLARLLGGPLEGPAATLLDPDEAEQRAVVRRLIESAVKDMDWSAEPEEEDSESAA